MNMEKSNDIHNKNTTRRAPLKEWWKNRSTTEKKLVVASSVAALSLLLILFVYLLLLDEPEVCTSSTCVRTSMELLNYMDIKRDPCEDFYRFSCGNFLENANLDNRSSSRTVKNILEDEIHSQIRNMLEQPIHFDDPIAFNLAKKFYRACTNETAIQAEGLKRMKQIFEQMGGWPTLKGNNWRENVFDWKDAVYKLRRSGINFEFFLILSLQRDKSNRDRYILSLKDPSYRPSQISNNVKNLYLNYMVDVAVLVGANKDRAKKDQREVMQFLLDLAKISEEAVSTNGTGDYNPHSLSELQYKFPEIPWFEYINKILSPAAEVGYDDVISVTHPMYVGKLQTLLKSTQKRIIANFMAWNILQHLINYLPTRILDRAYEYLEKVNGKVSREPRSKICLGAVETRLNSAISAAYLEKYFDEDTRHRAISMIRNIKHKFRQNLRELDWLDEKAKEMSSKKLGESVEYIASYNNLIEENRLYSEVQVFEDKLLTSVLNLDYLLTNIEYGKLRQPAENDFFRSPVSLTGLDIVYDPKRNVLSVPVGLFQGILYQSDRPQYLNYGALGAAIAHEIYHIIIEAEYKDLDGNLRSWWSSHSLLNYDEKLQCLSNRYGKYIVSKMDPQLQSNTSDIREEDMADLAGMKVAYDTYVNWVLETGVEARLPGLNYSPQQLFWISSAIYHCTKYSDETSQRYTANYRQTPAQFRVNGALQNLEEFALDFGCPSGTNMNPENKCRIW